MRLVRVDEDFRVIALGLPSPPYQGHPLDPPLRSRFQARDISGVTYKVSACDPLNICYVRMNIEEGYNSEMYGKWQETCGFKRNTSSSLHMRHCQHHIPSFTGCK